MKEMKRILSLVLALVMIVGVLPATALAANDTHYLVFATDRHSNTSIIGTILKNMSVGSQVEYVGLGGDMEDNQGDYNTSTVQSEVTAVATNASVDITKGSHDSGATDDAKILCTSSGPIETADDYYVYGVTQSDMEDSSSAQTAASAFVEWANGESIDTSKVIFVLSHMPIHAKRGDNEGAGYWHNALNEVATGSATGGDVVRNVVFFHGHNHTVDESYYFYNVNDTMSVQGYVDPSGTASVAEYDYYEELYDPEQDSSITTYAGPGGSSGGNNATASGTDATVYYTYATAGYLNATKKATLVTITDSTVSLTRYDSSGNGTELTTVERVAQSTTTTLESIAISGSTEYTVGDELALTVTATYSDTTTKDVTAEATLSGYDMSAAGTYTVTATYENLTATCEITVAAAQEPTTEPTESEKTVSYILAEGTTTYTVGDKLTFNVSVNYADGTSETLTQDDCQLTMSCTAHAACADVATAMGTVACEMGDYHNVTVTYGGKSDDYQFTVGAAEELTGEVEGVVVSVSSGVVSSVTAVASTNAYVADAMADKGEYVAYDITPEIALKPGNYATVTLPIPEGMEGVAVYYVSDDGLTVTDMNATKGDGVMTFVTDHFSTYVVEVTLPDDTEVKTEGSTAVIQGTGSYESTPVTVYKLVSAPEVGKEYLIVHDNDGEGYGLDGSTGAYETTALDTTNYYTTWDSESKTGTAVSADDVYATTSDAFLWTVGGSAGAYTFTNGNVKLGATCSESGFLWWTSTSYSLNFTGTGGNAWAYSSNTLSTTYSDDTFTNETIYLSRSGSTWSASGSGSSSVYFYEPVTLYQVTYNGTEGGTYTATGTEQLDVTTSNGKTITLTSALTFTTDSGTVTTISDLTDWTVTYEEVTDTSSILSVSDSTATLTGNVGYATLKVTYTHKTNTSWVVWDEFIVSTKLSSGTTVVGESGLHLDKTVELQADGTYTINLEAYSTGATVTTESEVLGPADIVLVLDMSNSMNQAVSSSDTTTRYNALVSAVNTFVNDLYTKAETTTDTTKFTDNTDDDDVEFRLSIIQFNSSATVRCALKDVSTASGRTTVASAISALTQATGTNPATGLEAAQTVFAGTATGTVDSAGNDDVEEIEGYTRPNYVIFFTDGYPSNAGSGGSSGHASTYAGPSDGGGDNSVYVPNANNAIYEAGILKTDYDATIYSIAVIGDADASYDWSSLSSEKDKLNFFLDVVSSNYPNATATEDSETLDSSAATIGSPASDQKYYANANTSTALSGIFTSIANDIQVNAGTTVTLDANSFMLDIIGDSFVIPEGYKATDVIVSISYGETDDGSNFNFNKDTINWTDNTNDTDVENATEAASAEETLKGNVIVTIGDSDVTVKGFDYSTNFISSGHGGYKINVTIPGILYDETAATDTIFATNGSGSGLYAVENGVTASTATEVFPQPRSVVTSKMYVLDYAKPVTLDENDWYAQTVNLATAYTTSSNYGTWEAADDGSALTYTPKTTQWGGYDTATVVGMVSDDFATVNDGQFAAAVATTISTGTDASGNAITYGEGANQKYVLSKVSVIPANNVYYEDDFITSEATGTVGIVYSGNWSVTDGTNSNTEVPEDKEDDGLGGVHGWIDSMDNDSTFSDGTSHVSSTVGANATFSFTGTGVDIYSYTDMESGMVIGMLYEGEPVFDEETGATSAVAKKTLMVDNLAVSGKYYQIPTLSFNDLTHGTYTVKLYVSSAKAVEKNEDGTVKVDENGDIVYKTDGTTRSTYYLDGIRVYNPLGETTNAYGSNQTTTFTEVRDIILETGALDITSNGTTINSAIYIDLDSKGTTGSIMDYDATEFADYGPKNEVYLGAGKAIVFSVDDVSSAYYIGLKSPTGTTTTAYLFGSTDYSVPFSHTTDQYYEIIPEAVDADGDGVVDGGNICIYNGGSTMLSITKIQKVSAVQTLATFGLRAISGDEAVSYAVASVASIDEVEEIVPEETVPEETVPEETVPDIEVEIENKVNEVKNTLRGFVNKLFGAMSNWFGR